ncbi:glycoside hydrolase family 3 N-terminal domain-containing protein [Sandarakinorhabdus oryzae]|uniref:glycoside hydrolase family 3 N-terminal domain-containing protein n=1 Tax=Sandarakinorhabdus oryzae TaxID=2675220 RepID=UPI0012E293FC|nr:glycoside hydrolase family 3 N-terminal domain-containing protein [Sandarakinorhabdus oryzae]
MADNPTARARALIAQMTLAEKAGQLSQAFAVPFLPPVDDRVAAGELGSLLFVTDPARINQLQRLAVEHSRLGIPLLFGFDVIHGLRTIFPVPLGMAASFDPELVEQAQAAAAAEARASGIHWAFAPMVDIARDPRWGRIVEGAGEDPHLGSQMAAAQVRGLQGPHIGTPGRVLAGPKHFLGYGAAPGGRDYEPVSLSDAEIRNVYLPPFAAALAAGAGNVMSAYMDLNQVPAVASKGLLDDLLRSELGFEGFVVSDANGVENQVAQHFAPDSAEAAALALIAGNDMEMALGPNAFAHLPALVEQGRVPADVLDRAVERVLVAKIRLGLFENPYVDEAAAAQVLATPAHRALAQMAAERSLVLLQNDGALPLAPGAAKRVAVIGPLADSIADTLGPWVFVPDKAETITVARGISERLAGLAQVDTAAGVQLLRAFPSGLEAFGGKVTPWSADDAANQFDRAVAAAQAADQVILVLGEAQSQSGERASAADLRLPGDQMHLLDAVLATGKPVVLVLLAGRPLDLTGITGRVPAILMAWYPGTRGGAAVAAALFGDVNPGGKLPVTWPRSVGQVPIHYARARTHTPDRADSLYHDLESTPLFPFGHGLSYTQFDFAPPQLDRPVLERGGAVTLTTRVRNSGSRSGDVVVQLYTHQRAGRAMRPDRELKGFQRVTLAAGESRDISFRIDGDMLSYWHAGERCTVLDPGLFDLWVGPDATADLHIGLQVN